MEQTCQDVVFGEMVYRHRWVKQKEISFLGKEWEIVVAAKAYSGKAITEEQRKSYRSFLNSEEEMLRICAEKLEEYIALNGIEGMGGQQLEGSVVPKTLLIQQDGEMIVLFDCLWDMEHGVAVKLLPEIAVGVQDLFL